MNSNDMFAALDTFDNEREHEHEHVHEAMFTDALSARQFILAGNATFTLRSKKTGTRYTYRVRASQDKSVYFVALLTGNDNETDYQYFGYIRRGVFFHGGRKARVGSDRPSVKGFAWTFRQLQAGHISEHLEIWHEGRCGRCGRLLTVPESIESGFGPECIQKIGG